MYNSKYKKPPTKKNKYSKKLLLISGGVVLIAATVAALELTDTTYWLHDRPDTQEITKAGDMNLSGPTDNPATAPQPPKKPTSNDNRNIGGANDTGGSATAPTDKSQWVTSKTGKITVKQPSANATIKDGAVLSGSAKVEQVHFRLIDDKLGVISQGELNVVDGKFSGVLHFDAQSSNGRLDVFSTDDIGVEYNEIQMAVKY